MSSALVTNFVLAVAGTAVLVFFGILALFEVGRLAGKRRAPRIRPARTSCSRP
jgi:hypothetical protein